MWKLRLNPSPEEVDKYKIVKCGRCYQVCKVLKEFEREDEAVRFMLKTMNDEFDQKYGNLS